MDQNRVGKFVDSLRERQPPAAAGRIAPAPPGVAANAASSPAGRTDESTQVFDPNALAKLGRLELIARTVVDGFLSGKHRSTHKGGCTDFAEFRPYARGDDVRLLDWRHYARSDRYYVKRYDDETNLQALLIVDASGSMSFGMSTVSKWRYAQMAAASLAHLLLRQRDSVGLAMVGKHLLKFVKPQPRSSHLVRVLDLLGAVKPTGASSLPDVLAELTGRLKRRGLVIIFSDCFGDTAALRHVLEQYRYHGHDVILFQILAPEELSFPFRREAFFQDLEISQRLQINPNTVRKHYLEEFQAFMNRLRQEMSDISVDLITVSTADDLSEVLSYHLRRRAAMKNPHRAAVRA
ncbi:MAG: DUF58 domain-containing protein [Pirellulales bacterium]